MTLSSRAQAFSVDNLLRSSRHATREIQPTAPPDGHLVKAREDDRVSPDGTTCEIDVRKERNWTKSESQEINGHEDKHHVRKKQHVDHKVAESVSSCFCHGDLTFCIHPAALSVKDESGQSGNSITAELLHADLWSSFHRLGTEMIITKSGRRMFPALKMRISGLNTEKDYTTRLEFVQPDCSKYRYIYPRPTVEEEMKIGGKTWHKLQWLGQDRAGWRTFFGAVCSQGALALISSRWMISGTGDTMTSVPSHMTLECPTSGHVINSQVLSFERLKLTNSEQRKSGQVSLVSMQKFQPKIVIQEDVGFTSRLAERYVIVFPQTSFMAVTAYQNQQITTLKIASNPFAKGFRESGKMRYPEALSSQVCYYTAETLPMAGLSTVLQPHTPSSFLPVSDVRIGSKRPLPSPLTNSVEENSAAKLSRLAESKRISEQAAPPVIYPTSVVSSGQSPLHLSASHLPYFQQLADPTAYLRSPYLPYSASMKDAYSLPGRSHTPTRYADVPVGGQSRSPTPIAISAANRQPYETSIFPDDRLSINNQSIRNRLIDPDATTALSQHSTISPMPQSRPSSTSSRDRLSSDISAKDENHSMALRHIKRDCELYGHSDGRRHFPNQYYPPTSPTSVNAPIDLKRHATGTPESFVNGYECAPANSFLSQRLSGKFNVLSESLRSYSQFHWRQLPLSDVSKCLTSHSYNDARSRHHSEFERHQAAYFFDGPHRLLERNDRQGPVIDTKSLFRCTDEENVKPISSAILHDGLPRSAYCSMQTSKDDRLLLIH